MLIQGWDILNNLCLKLAKKYTMNFKKIFIIGAGPAGLACSYYLSKSNYKTNSNIT